MNILSARSIQKLDSKGQSELIAEITRALFEQKAENDQLKAIAERAGQANTLWKTLTIIVSVVIIFSGAVLWFGGLWGDWTAVRDAHRNEQDNGQIVYDHRDLSDLEIKSILSNLDLPEGQDLSPYALITDTLKATDLSGYVKYGQKVQIQFGDASGTSVLTSSSTPLEGGFIVTNSPGTATTWKIVKE